MPKSQKLFFAKHIKQANNGNNIYIGRATFNMRIFGRRTAHGKLFSEKYGAFVL